MQNKNIFFVGLISLIFFSFAFIGCNPDINQSQKVKVIEEHDPVVKIIEERDSIVIINRRGDKSN